MYDTRFDQAVAEAWNDLHRSTVQRRRERITGVTLGEIAEVGETYAEQRMGVESTTPHQRALVVADALMQEFMASYADATASMELATNELEHANILVGALALAVDTAWRSRATRDWRARQLVMFVGPAGGGPAVEPGE